MKQKRYVMYDDMRKIGTYYTLKEVYDTGLIKCNRIYFHRAFSRESCYLKDNICVYPIREQAARCLFLAHLIQRRAKSSPNTFLVDNVLTRALKEITNCELS